MPNDAESVFGAVAYDVAQDRKNPEYVTPSSNQGLVKCCVMGELRDPGACAFSVDSVDWSTPVADMPSAPQGLPMDLLDRVLIVSTKLYTESDIQEIIQIRYVIT